MAVLGEIQDYQIAASAVFVISTLGLVVNCLVFLFVLRIPSMANPFGHLVTNQSIGNVIHLCLFSFYFSPMVFFDIDAMKKYSHYCGVFLIMSFEVSLYTHTVISLNRFCAICLPFRYRRIFTFHNTIGLITLVWLVSTIPVILIYGFGSCKFQYRADYWRFGIMFDESCPSVPFPTNLSTYAVFICIIIVLDFVTLHRIRLYNKQIAEQQHYLCWSQPREYHEVKFLRQACTQAVYFIITISIYFYPPHSESRWVKFSFATINWVSVHVVDGLITIAYNRTFRRVLCQPKSSTVTTKT